MKVWGGNYDGVHRVIVAAKTAKAAHEAVSKHFRVSYYSWRQFTTETANQEELEVALAAPGTVFRKRAVRFGDKFMEVK